MKKLVYIWFAFCLIGFSSTRSFGQVTHTESFDGTTFAPSGWTVNGTYSSTTYLNRVTSSTLETATPHSGAGFCRFRSQVVSSTASGNLHTPKIDYTNRGASTPTISLWVYRDVNATYNTTTYDAEGVGVYVNTTTSSTFTGATLLGFIPRRGGLAASGTYLTTSTNLTVAAAGWYQYSFDIPSTYTSCAYIGFKMVPKTGRNTYIDDIVYTSYPAAVPGCAGISSPANASTGLSPNNPPLTLNWTAPTGCYEVDGYKLYLGTDAAATNILNGVNIGAVTTYTPTLSTNTTYYWKVVPYNSAGDAVSCTIWSFSTGAMNPSCTASGSCVGCTRSDGLTYTDWITDVYMGTISRYVAGAEGYVNTGLSTNVVIGTNYTLTVYTNDNNGDGTGNYIFVYVDWNQDGDFQDASETITSYAWPGNITVTPPSGALAGSTVMRIMQRDDTEGWDPSPAGCGDMYLGEVEDYRLNVCATQITVQPSATYTTCATIGSQTISATTSNATGHQWQYSANGSTGWASVVNNTPAGATYSGNTTNSLVVSGITTAATYYYRLQATGGCTATSTTASLIVRSISTDMTSLTSTSYTVCPGNSATLTANGGTRGYNNAPWKWYSGSCGGTLVATTTTNTLAVTPTATTTYYVRFEGTCNNTNCVSTTITVGGTASSAPTGTTASSTNICNGNSTTLTATGGSLGAGANWVWYSGSCGGTLVGTGSPITVSPGATTTYFVRAEGCNVTTCVSRAITVTNIPACNSLTSPANAATNQCRNTTLQWGTSAGATGYKLYLGTDAAATNIYNGVSLGAVTSTVVPTLAASTVHYWKIVPTNSCGDASGCTIRSFTTKSSPCYCTATTCCGGGSDAALTPYDYITYVSIGTVSRSSGYDSYYSHATSTNVVIGTNYTLNVQTNGNQWNYLFVYADWNQDGDFQDAGETITSYASGTWNFNVTVNPPAGAAAGTTVLRIMQMDDNDGAFPPSPAGCGDVWYGDVEDYLLTVCSTQITAQPSATYTTCATIGSQTISATAANATSYQWQYSANGSTGWANVANGTPAGATYSGGTSSSLVVSGITTAATYYYRLNAIGASCTATSTNAALTVRSISTDPTSATATSYTVCPGNSATLTVNGGSLGYLASWKWYSGSCGGTLAGTGTTLAVTPGATTTYYVRAEGTCNNTNCASVTITVGGTASSAATGTTASSTNVCNGSSTTLTATGGTLGAGAQWVWYTGSCGGTLVGTGSPITVSPGASTTYYVRAEGCNVTTCVTRAITVSNVPNCNTLTAPANGATGQCRNITLQWGSSASTTGYKLYLGTDAAATNLVNGTNLGITYSYTSTLLANTTYYWKIVPTNSCGDAVGCTIRSFTTGSTLCYCTATTCCGGGTDGLGNSYDYISYVGVGSISNSTGYDSYGNYTNLSTNVVPGSSYGLTVQLPGWQWNYVWAYADWNQDGDFQDANETIINGSYSNWSFSGTIAVPAGATLGTTVLRIMQTDDSDGAWPSPAGCGDVWYGDVEDYALNVCNISVSANPISQSACVNSTVIFTASGSNTTGFQWQVSTNGGASWSNVTNGGVYSGATTANLTITGVTTGMNNYQYRCVLTGSCSINTSAAVLTVTSPTYSVNGCTYQNLYINNFSTTGGVSNISNATGCTTSPYYTDYSAQIVSQLAGNSFNFTVTTAATTGYPVGFRIWVDWNNDNDFSDAGEDVWNSSTTGYSFSGTINIPVSSSSGTVRMRVRSRYNAVPTSTSSCSSISSYGETEDYRVQVLACTFPTTQASFNSFTSLGSSSVTANWTRGNGNNVLVVAGAGVIPTAPTSGVSYTANSSFGSGSACGGGYVVYNGSGTSVNITNLTSNTTYYFQIYEYASSGPCYLTPAGSANVTTLIAWRSAWVSMNIGSSNWCAGETRVISVTVQNIGTNTWSDASPDVNIGVKWNADADYFVRVNAGNLASGATQTYSFTVTAPTTPGANNLSFDVVKEGDCWFASNSGNCGPGNSVLTSASLSISAVPTTANAGPNQNLCSVTSATLAGNTPSAGTGIWSLVSGSATITNPNNPTTTITGLSVGAVQLQWTISNSPCTASSSNVTITVSNAPSLAGGNAGPDQYLCAGTTSCTMGATGGAGTWTQISGPNTASITNPNSLNATITGMISGTYVFRWAVTNGCGSVYDDVVIVIE